MCGWTAMCGACTLGDYAATRERPPDAVFVTSRWGVCACDAMSHVACVLLDVERVNVKGRIRCNEAAAGDRGCRGDRLQS